MTKDYVQSRGFKLIYADTDSVFVKKGWCNKRRVRAVGGAAEQPNRTADLIRPPLQVPHTTTIGRGREHEGSKTIIMVFVKDLI